MQKENLPLVASEISGLWNTYLNDSLSICVFKHFLNNVDDKSTKELIQKAQTLSEKHLKEIKKIFEKENLPLPTAFGEDDVNLKAPRLFEDAFYLYYLSNMLSFGIDAYAVVLRYLARQDIRCFFKKCITDAVDLYQQVIDLRLNQGIFVKAPRIEVTKNISFMEKESLMESFTKNNRPLLAREVTNIFSGILIDVLWRAMLVGFGQTAITKEVKDFMFRGREIASNHFKSFSDLLVIEHLPVPSFSEAFVTDSTTSTFSERLIMMHTVMLCHFAISVDGVAITSSTRPDLLAIHTRFGAEILKYASDGTNIMIRNKWMERPPQVINHMKLSPV